MTAGWPRLRFCEAPDVSAPTRLNLHNAGVEMNGDVLTLADGFSLGMAGVDSPARARRIALGDRVVALPVEVVGSKTAATYTLNLIARELLRPTNWLEVHVAAEVEPRWLRTYASVPSPVSLDEVYNDASRRDRWFATLQVAVDPLALGPARSLGSWTVTNTPSSMSVTLPEVDGEASAPLLVKATRAAAGGMLGPAVGVARVAPVVAAAPSSWAAGVGSAVTDSSYVAGSYRQTTGALSSWTDVATWAPGAVPDGEGRWAALLRVGGSTGAGALRLRWRASGAGAALTSAPVVVDVQAAARWVRTGEVPLPLAGMAGLGVTIPTTLTLQVQRISSGGEHRLDGPLMLVPAGPDADLLVTSPDVVTSAGVTVVIDAGARRTGMAAGTTGARSPGAAGGWPTVTPGQPNVLTFWQGMEGGGDDKAATAQIDVSYQPRYLWGV